MLVSSNAQGCSDTAFRIFDAQKTTEIDFLFQKIICVDKRISVIAQHTLSKPPNAFHWDMGEPGAIGNLQSTITEEVYISYRSPGKKKVGLKIDLPNGCTISDSTTITVFNSANIRKLEMSYAQYTDDNKIEAIFSNVNLPYLEKLNVFRNNTLVDEIVTQPINSITDSTFDKSLKNCYNLSISDICGEEGQKGRTHCPINLEVALENNRQVRLDWTYYVGWDKVAGYAIHRQYPDSAFKVIDTVFNTQKTYVDSLNVCDVAYNYKVLALKPESIITSQSNTETITPTIDENLTTLLFDNVSVFDNDTIELRWSPSTYRFNDGYLITKYANTIDNFVDTIRLDGTNLFYKDNENVSPELHPYLYKLHQVDNCKKITKTDDNVETIFLSGGNDNLKSVISWTEYSDWDYPIVEHHVENIGRFGKIYLNKIDAGIFNYTDRNFYEDIGGYYFYQIHSVNSNGDTSYSNIAYISGDGKIYSPNSFTPNGDGLNDVFRFKTLFVTNAKTEEYTDFEFTVLNRWGQIVYISTDLDNPWDGKYKGEIVKPGVYHYKVKFTDGKEKRFHDVGIIHVIW
jgi:gliding motility-associated-like protein